MIFSEVEREKVSLIDVPNGHVIEIVGFRGGKEVGSGFRGIVRGKQIELLPNLNLEPRIRVEIMFGDGRELRYDRSLPVYCLGPETKLGSQPVVPGLRPSRILVR